MTTLSKITLALVIIAIIGALNWGLIGFFNFNLVDAIFGGGSAEQTSAASRVVYAIVGLCGLIAVFMLGRLVAPESLRRNGAAVGSSDSRGMDMDDVRAQAAVRR
jgi:uncharacterized membrane protein YuzA (DUF378 family)